MRNDHEQQLPLWLRSCFVATCHTLTPEHLSGVVTELRKLTRPVVASKATNMCVFTNLLGGGRSGGEGAGGDPGTKIALWHGSAQ